MTSRPGFGFGTAQVIVHPDAERTVAKEITPFMRIVAKDLEARAKLRAAVGPPRSSPAPKLRGSIKGRVVFVGKWRTPVAEVTANTPHAQFVEMGTGRRGKRTVNIGVAGPLKGPPPGYVHGPGAGMVAQPYLRPALWEALRTHFNIGGR